MNKQTTVFVIHHRRFVRRGNWLVLLDSEGLKLTAMYYANNTFTARLFLPYYAEYRQRDGLLHLNRLEPEYSQAQPLLDESMLCGLYINELVCRLRDDLQPAPELFEQYQRTVAILSGGVDELALREFEWTLFAAQGANLDFSKDANGMTISEHDYYRFDVRLGGLVSSPSGIEGRVLLSIASRDFASNKVLKTAKIINRQLIDFLLGGASLISRELIKGQSVKSGVS